MSPTEHDILRIDAVEVPRVSGRLGLCACPGTRHLPLPPGDARSVLLRDLEVIRDFGAAGVVTLVDQGEMAMLGLDAMPATLEDMGLWWKHLPIADMGVPSRVFESRWEEESADIHASLAGGVHVVLHCWAGLGRTGTVAARLLVESGLEPEAAVLRVRDARPGSIQTRKQEKYVLRLRPGER